MSAKFNRKGNGLLDSENDQSPTSSQFIRKENKMRLGRQFESQNMSNKEQETIEDALIDLYLSVKIRSNEEIDAYNEEVLQEERERLKDTNPFTILEYIKTSIEILMNMKMEEHQDQASKNKKASGAKAKKPRDNGQPSETESNVSADEPPADYEQMLQKYEAEVRNHIKIEQQLKLHIECVQDKLEEQEKLLRAELKQREGEKSENALELNRYKDLLSLREQEVDSYKKMAKEHEKQIENLNKKMVYLEKEKKELSNTLIKHQRGISPFKVQSRSQYQVIDDLQDVMVNNRSGNQEMDDLRQNYNQYIAGSRTHKNNSGKQTTIQGNGPASSSLTNQTMYLFKSHGSTERVNSSNNKNQLTEGAKFKKEFIKSKVSNREFLNRSALNNKADPNAITIPMGQSPDRSKNMSVYSMGPANQSHGASGGILGPTKSPYLGQTQITASGGMKKRLEKEASSSSGAGQGQSKNSKKESLLANANFKNSMISQQSQQQNTHNRTKSQNAASVNLKLQSAQNYQKKIQENNKLIQNLGNPNNPQQPVNIQNQYPLQRETVQNASEESLNHDFNAKSYANYNSQPPMDNVYNQQQMQQHQLDQNGQPIVPHGGAYTGQQIMPQGHHQQFQQVQQIPTNIISGTYINSNIIVHHQKTKSTVAQGVAGNRKQSAKHHSSNRAGMNMTVQGHYSSNSQNLVGMSDIDAGTKKQLIPQPNDSKTLITASGGHMRGNSYQVDRGQFQSTQQLNSSNIQGQIAIKNQSSQGTKSITDSKKRAGSKQATIQSKGSMNNTDTNAMLSSQLANFQRSQIQKSSQMMHQSVSSRKHPSHGRSSTSQSIHNTGGLSSEQCLIQSNQAKMQHGMGSFNSTKPNQAISQGQLIGNVNSSNLNQNHSSYNNQHQISNYVNNGH